jgi:ribose 5-phosphate isomerase
MLPRADGLGGHERGTGNRQDGGLEQRPSDSLNSLRSSNVLRIVEEVADEADQKIALWLLGAGGSCCAEACVAKTTTKAVVISTTRKASAATSERYATK